MPFSVECAAQSFRHLMDQVLQDLNCTFVYPDDILEPSFSAQSHIDAFHAVFHRQRHHGLVINIEKYLSECHHLIFGGIKFPMPFRVNVLKDFPQPRDVKAVQEFLGTMNFTNVSSPTSLQPLRPSIVS
ncbi:Pol polyprotein [Elysia marginata]|uniref:Pol polyprotein n=1 Tax=Elysia marginata TaxID=1093978 RepID=A0AAV4HYC5_9GAST|nr:Pol polyprotein [Elysia marginata]